MNNTFVCRHVLCVCLLSCCSSCQRVMSANSIPVVSLTPSDYYRAINTKFKEVDDDARVSTTASLAAQDLALYTSQYCSLVATDATPSSLLSDAYTRLYDSIQECIAVGTVAVDQQFYPSAFADYYRWLLSGMFADGVNNQSTDAPAYTIPTITPTTSATTTFAAGGTTALVVGTFPTSNTVYETAGTSAFTTPIKQLLDATGGWKTITNFDAGSGIVLHRFTVTAVTTYTLNNVVFRYVAFNFNNTPSGLSLLFNSCSNVVFENCVFNVPRNTGDGVLYFNIIGASGGVSIKDCVFRNTTTTDMTGTELIGVSGMTAGTSIVVQDNSYTLNWSSTQAIGRMFFTIPNTIPNNVLGNIYIVGNLHDDVGLANSNSFTDSSVKAVFAWRISSTRIYAFKVIIDNNTFTNCGIFNDHAVVSIGGTIPLNFIQSSDCFVYVRNTNIPNTYKKVILMARQLTYTVSQYNSSPLFYLPGSS